MHAIATSESSASSAPATPPVTSTIEAEVDMEVLKVVPKAFAIEDEKSANWLIRKIVSARQYAVKVKKWAEEEQRRAEREEKSLLFLFGRQLEDWTKGEIEKLNGRRKSLHLPGGVVGYRTVNPCLQIDDEQIVLTWAMSHCPAAVVTIQKLVRTQVKEHFERTGEMPLEGAHIEGGGERFFIREAT